MLRVLPPLPTTAMQIQRAALDDAATRGLIDPKQCDALWAFLLERDTHTASFRPAHILYYLGGLLAIGAMTLFMTLGWESFGGGGLFVIAVVYGAAAIALTNVLLKRQLRIPAGLVAAVAVALVPMAVYGAQQALGLWPDGDMAYRDYHTRIDWRWLLMEFATLAAGAIALWRYRLPFLVMPVAVTLWYMGMDLVPFLLGADNAGFFSVERKWISVIFGLAMTTLAFWVDLRTRRSDDYAFWLYLFGVLTFWGGLTALDSNNEFGRFAYALINVSLIVVGAALSRRVFAVFGGLGLALYLGHLSHTLFKDSLLFPVALTVLGGVVIAAGIAWQRHETTIGMRLRRMLPQAVADLVARRQG
jgi:hypothetical protein